MSTTHTHATRRLRRTAIASALALALTGAGTVVYLPYAAAQQAAPAAQQYSIPAGSLREALDALAAQGDVSVMYSPELVAGKNTKGLSGRYSPGEALRRLLANTGLAWDAVNGTTFVLKRAPASQPAAPAKTRVPSDAAAAGEEVTNMPAIMVTGTKTLNMDITRTEDDPQPYVVFDREQIERSGATSLEQFLQERLTMNTGAVNTGGRIGNVGATTSEITLRGLSAAQTLILIDGHRVSSPAFSASGVGTLNQADITGIPLGAIDRIEVLPTTASGIYGGNATGGVINIIMRRDYIGAQINATYDNTFSTDVANRKLDLVFGHNFNESKTSLLVTANYSDANELVVGDRNLVQRGRDAIWNNNPAWFLGPTGSPPLGATPNIASVDGSNLVLDDGTPLNASFTSVPTGYAGIDTDGGAALLENAGNYNWNLANTAQTDSRSGSGRNQALYTRPTIKTGSLALRHQFSSGLQIFTDLSSSHTVNRFLTGGATSSYQISAESPNNPFDQDIRVSLPLYGSDAQQTTEIERGRALVGLVKQLTHDWQLGVDYTWDRTTVTFDSGSTARAFADAVEDGSVDILRDPKLFPVDIGSSTVQQMRTTPFRTTMRDLNLRVSGPLGNLPGGSPTLTASVAHRDESVPSSLVERPDSNLTVYYPERSQSVNSAYIEIRVPIFSERNARRLLQELDLQIAARRDAYKSESGSVAFLAGTVPSLPEVARNSNTFTSLDPTIALQWKPIKGLAFRASYGTGFLPPALDQLVPTISPFVAAFGNDPRRGNTTAGPYTRIFGGNPNLQPEKSESHSFGVIFTPQWEPNLRLSVDYTRIKKTDNIAQHPGGIQGLIDDETLFPERVVRGEKRPGDPPEWAGPITLLDLTSMNLARAELSAWDVKIDYRKDTSRHGALEIFFMGTWQPHYRVQTVSSQPMIENVGISYRNPLKFRSNAGLVWSRGAWRAGWNIIHFNSYSTSRDDLIIANQGRNGKISSQTYNNLFIDYDFGLADRSGKLLAGTRIQFGVRNIFKKNPPLDTENTSGFYSPFGDPRISSWYVSVEKQF